MKVRELIDLLSLEYPESEVVAITTMSEKPRYLQVLGKNSIESSKAGNLVLNVDWSVKTSRVVETEEDRIRRERDRLDRQLAAMTAEQKKEVAKKITHKNKDKRSYSQQQLLTAIAENLADAETGGGRTRKSMNRTPEEQIAAGFIPTGKRGRPRKAENAIKEDDTEE